MLECLKKLFNKSVVRTIEEEAHQYVDILNAIHEILITENYKGQAEVIKSLLVLLNTKQYSLFAERLTSIDMWGGSGAVWEVGFDDASIERLFQIEIIKLIDLMETTAKVSFKIKRVRTLFKEDLAK